MAPRLYAFLVSTVRLFSHRMKIEWETPFNDEPCVFVMNHAGATGPIKMATHFPLRNRCHPWINSPVLDRDQMPEYVRIDHWWDENSFWAPLLSRILPPLAAAIIPPIMKEANGVPVYRDHRIMSTLRSSLSLLKKGEYLVIFPEAVSGHNEYSSRLHTGWLSICELYHRTTGEKLKIYPVRIDCKEHVFRVFSPLTLDPERTLGDQQYELCDQIASCIIDLQ